MFGRVAAITVVALVSGACSPAAMGMRRMADALTATAGAYARDNDPEFVRIGAPATLKMVEMMLDRQPSHPGLLLTACSGFTQYAYAFLQVEGEMTAVTDAAAARELQGRAARMYERAKGYCLRALDARGRAVGDSLQLAPIDASRVLQTTTKEDVPALFWAAAAWAGELSAANQLLRIGELAAVRALLSRALALDEAWGDGAIHEAMIALEGLPAAAGGSPERARRHFDRAVSLGGGQSAFPNVTMAESVALPARQRPEFEALLKQALAVDVSRKPEIRLANLIAQRRARFLLAQADRLFKTKTGGWEFWKR